MKPSQEAIIFKQHNIQATANRKVILGIFLENSRPLDTQFILDELKKKKISMDRVTVFRTINSFVKSGLLNKLEFNEGKSRYELTINRHHHHLVCTKCGRVTCIDECNIESVENKISKENRFKITSHRVEFFGVCSTCLERAL